jgi:hypothetical protein
VTANFILVNFLVASNLQQIKTPVYDNNHKNAFCSFRYKTTTLFFALYPVTIEIPLPFKKYGCDRFEIKILNNDKCDLNHKIL